MAMRVGSDGLEAKHVGQKKRVRGSMCWLVRHKEGCHILEQSAHSMYDLRKVGSGALRVCGMAHQTHF